MKKQFKTNFEKSILVFKKWNRKGYSVFNTLNKIVKITTLSLSYSIVLIPLQVLCQTDTTVTRNLDLEEVIVSAQRAPVIYSQLSRQVTTINEDEIKRMPVSNVNDLLKIFSGIDVRQRGANGIQSDMSIRGGSFDQNLILLNGVNITDPQTGHHSLNLPINLNSIERIEILEGPGSRVFGPNAFSGAVNIITNQSDKNYTKAEFTVGDFGLFSESLVSSYKINNTKHFISISKSQSNGYINNTDYDQYNLFYNSNFKSEIGNIDFQIGYSNKEFGANSFYTPEYPDQYEETKTTFTSLKFETGDNIKLIPVVYFRRHQDRFELFREDDYIRKGDVFVKNLSDTALFYPGRYESWNYYSGHNYHITDVYGIKLDSRISTKYGITSFGAELRSENIWSNVLGNLMSDTINVKDDPYGFYSRKYSRTISNYFLEHFYSFDRFSFSTGLLASWVSENDFQFNIYPGIDLSYSFPKNVKIYATVNKSLRLPTFTDLFYSGPSNVGNPNLKSEEAWSYEAGLKLKNSFIKSNLSIYYRDSKNLIAWVKPIDAETDVKWETQNLTDVKTQGFTISNLIQINKFLIDFVNIDYNYLHQQDAGSGAYDSKYSLNYLKHNLIINVNHKICDRLNLSWNVKYQDRAGSYLKYDINIKDYIGEYNFNPFWVFDAKLAWNYKLLSIYTEVSNIFNNNYTDIGNIEMSGRWFKTGLEVHISY